MNTNASALSIVVKVGVAVPYLFRISIGLYKSYNEVATKTRSSYRVSKIKSLYFKFFINDNASLGTLYILRQAENYTPSYLIYT